MSAIRDHRERDGICLHDHEVWPCKAAQLIADVLQEVATMVRPTTAEPRDSEISFERWQTRHFVAEEIEDKIPDGVKGRP